MAANSEANFTDFLTHLYDSGVYHNVDNNIVQNDYEWGFFISPDNTRTKQILLNREFISKAEVNDICSRLRIPKMKAVY